MDLTVCIPARNEGFLNQTVQDILKNMRGDTEVIAVCDGYWPDPQIPDHPRVNVIHFTDPVGQRAGTNAAARLSRAEFVMKCDGHCAFDVGFDVKLLAPYKDGTLGKDVTTIPRLYNLHAFDWQCSTCGNRTYQGAQPTKCEKCQGERFEMFMVWQPRLARRTDFGRIDKELRFQYWRQCQYRLESQPDIADVMCHVGACWMMHRERFWELGGLDEGHGSWGQMGVEISLKSWLSGGRQVVNKTAWYSHMFRTQQGWQWPYKITSHEVNAARDYSRDFWLNNKWTLQKRDFNWLLEKFRPVPEWHQVESEQEVYSHRMEAIKREKSPRRRARRLSECSAKQTQILEEMAKVEEAKKEVQEEQRTVVVDPDPKPSPLAPLPPRPSEEEFKEEPAEFLFMSLTPRASKLYRKLMEELARQGMIDREEG